MDHTQKNQRNQICQLTGGKSDTRSAANSDFNIPILYEDKSLLVVNKPSGLTVNKSETAGYTLQDWVDDYLSLDASDSSDIFHQRSGIVHRLDKDTSGCLIIAKTPAAFLELQLQFKSRRVRKEYLALVHGYIEPREGIIRAPLGRSRYDRQKFAVTPGGRISETSYRVVSRLTNNDLRFSLLSVFPKTGRTHQIRVHLRYFGHPIVADVKYAGGKQAVKDLIWCPRLFLHAAKITFTHPVSLKSICVRTDLPEDLENSLSQFLAHVSS